MQPAFRVITEPGPLRFSYNGAGMREWRRTQVVKGEVCKTFMHRFESDRRLFGPPCIQKISTMSSEFCEKRFGSGLCRPSATTLKLRSRCILSLRTQDRTTNAASERLFAMANTLESMLGIPVGVIEKAIYPV